MKITKDKFSLLMDNIQDGYVYHQIVRDSSGTPVDYIFIDVNPAFETITGLARIDIIGKLVTEVMPGIKESGFDWIDAYEQLAYTGKPIQFESFSELLNRWHEISASSPEDGYITAYFRDITESKRIKETLIVSETRYRRLFESAKDGILILDAESGKITDANPFLLELLGLSKEEILGKPIWEIGTFKDVIESKDNFLELQQKEYIRYEDLPLQTVEGRLVAVEFISNVYLEGQHKVIQCNIRDITDRRRLELFRKLFSEVLAILNESGDFHDAIQRILSTMKSATGFDAIGLRLQDGEDFPYYSQLGISEDFLSTEDSPVSRNPMGDVCRNSGGSISLECTCGLVLSGKTDPSNPLFTPGGSFWTNDSFPLLELPASEDQKLHPMNHCKHKGYASVALVPIRKNQKIVGLLQLNDRRKDQFTLEAINVLEAITSHIGEALVRTELVRNLANTNYKLIQAYDNTIKGWAHALDLKDHKTEDHSQRSVEMTVNIAREMGMSEEELVHVRRGALLHDIGKMGVSDSILLKPGHLTKKEWAIMRQHPTFAFEMLSPIEYLRPALDIPYSHHEKWDGTGYPRGLKREEIPLAARIFAVVDVYDDLTSDRPYSKAWSRKETLKNIRQESGRHFDPKVVEMFFEEAM